MATSPPLTSAVEPGGHYETAQRGKFSVSSNSETKDQISESISVESKLSKRLDPEAVEVKEAEPEPEEVEVKAKGGPQKDPETGRFLPKEGKDAEEVSRETKDEKPIGKPRDDPRARMLEATRKEAEAKKERDAARKEAEEARAEVNRLRQSSAAAPSAGDRPAPVPAAVAQEQPKPESFKTYEEFVDARARFNAREEIRQVLEAQEKQRRADSWSNAVTQKHQAYLDRLTERGKADPDWDAKGGAVAAQLRQSYMLKPGEQKTAGHVISDHIALSEVAPELCLHFADHPEDFQRIASLQTPWHITREMAKLEARLEKAPDAAPAGTVSRASTARPPVRPVTGAPVNAEDEENMPDAKYIAMNLKRARQRR